MEKCGHTCNDRFVDRSGPGSLNIVDCLDVNGGSMSMIWYGVRKPITSIAVKERPGNSSEIFDIILWLDHQQAGRFIVRIEELRPMIDMFIQKDRGILYQQVNPGGKVSTSWIGPEDYQGQVISEDYMQNIVHRDDYNMGRAEHLWESRVSGPSDDQSVVR